MAPTVQLEVSVGSLHLLAVLAVLLAVFKRKPILTGAWTYEEESPAFQWLQ